MTDLEKFLLEENKQLRATISKLTEEIENLTQVIKELQENRNKNSRNSSKPPSSDGLEKPPAPKSNREPSGKRPGGQQGHTGHGLKKLKADQMDDVPHRPRQCEGCPHAGQCELVCRSPIRHEYDIKITIVDRQHYTEAYACKMDNGSIISGEFPSNITSSQQYGSGLKSFVSTLNTEGMMGIKRIHDFVSCFGIPYSTGSIAKAVKELSALLAPAVKGISEALLRAPVVNCDETGFRTDGSLHWIHAVCDSRYTFLSVHSKRGEEAMREIGFLPAYNGIAMHDCWSPYWKFPQLLHALCNAHIMRELKGHRENHPEQAWIAAFRALLQEMDHSRNEIIRQGGTEIPGDVLADFNHRYDEYMETAVKENPIPERKPGQRGKTAKGKLRSLIDRLIEHKGEFCLFLTDFRVGFTNNPAEQSIRMAKVKGKVSGSMRTVSGADDFVTIMSYIGTVKKQGFNVFEAIRTAFAGKSYQLLFPATE